MSASRRLCLSRKRDRKSCPESTSEISDDFQDAATVFRLPKRLRTCKPQSKSKKSMLDPDTKDGAVSSIKKEPSDEHITHTHQQNQHLEILESKISKEESDFKDIEKILCSESEKLCPLCKLIVPSAVFSDHFKDCLRKFKVTKRGCENKFPLPSREEEANEQEEQQLVLPCPVCKKPFKSKTQRVSHIKTCAQDHGLTSEQLLLASRLLEKQTEEWSELGLPTALQLPNTKRKAHRNAKHTKNLNDPDIAMAIALSRSIVENEVESRISREEKLFALGMEDIVNEDRKVKPVLLQPPPPGKQMRKGAKSRKGSCRLQNTLLATRSVEERERLISEKVAILLTSDDTTKVGWISERTPKQSRRLACLVNQQCKLWEAARSDADEPLHNFYVPELEPYIYPKETVIGSLFKQLSQIPGRLNTTALHALDEESESECEMVETSGVDEFCTQMALAELMGSHEEQNNLSEIEWEQATEVMENHGFLLPSQVAKVQEKNKSTTSILENYCDSQLCELNGNDAVNTEGALKENPDDHIQVNTVELKQNSDLKNKSDTSQLTEGPLYKCKRNNENIAIKPCRNQNNLDHNTDPYVINDKCDHEFGACKVETMSSVVNDIRETSSQERSTLQNITILFDTAKDTVAISEDENKKHNTSIVSSKKVIPAELHSSKSSKLDNKGHAENICLNSHVDSQRQSQKHDQSIDTASNFAGCNNTTTPHSLFSISSVKNNTFSEYDNDVVQLKDSTLHSSQYNTDVFTSTLKTHDREYEKTACEVSQMGSFDSHINNIVHQSGGKDTKNCSETSKILQHEIVISPLKEEAIVRNNLPYTKSGSMVDTLIQNWKDILQSGIGSDVTILTSDGFSLAAHSLVLLARCPQLYKESKVYGDSIKLDNISRKTAHHFLSYLYTGTCEVTTPDDPLWIALYDVALRYNCSDLVSYMELLYKSKSTPLKITDVNMKSLKPRINSVDLSSAVPSATEIGKHTPSLKVPVINLEKDLELGNIPSNSISDSANRFMMDCGKILKPTRLFSEIAEGEVDNKNSPESKFSKFDLPVTCKGQDKSKHMQWDKVIQSPDLFDESLDHPPLIDISQHSPHVKLIQPFPKEQGKKIYMLPDTSSPCKLDISVEEKEDKEITREKDIAGHEQYIPIAISCSPLPPLPERLELDDCNDVSDNDVDLRHSDSEASVTDHQTDNICKDSIKKTSCMDYDNEEPLACESVDTHEHYISNVWDDFDTGDSPMTILERLSTSLNVCEITNSNVKPGSCLTPLTQSSSHHVSTPLLCHEDCPQEKLCSDILQSSKHEESKCFKLDTKCTVSAIDCIELTEGHPSDETLINMAVEMEQLDDNLNQTRNQTPSKLVSPVDGSSPILATPHQMYTLKRKLVTPQPDYGSMKSPDLKKELNKYGVCKLGRKKAVMMLQHIYEQTHPFVTDSEAETSLSQTPQRSTETDKPKLLPPQIRERKKYGLASEKQIFNKQIPTEKVAVKKSVASVKEGEGEMKESEDSLLNSSQSSTSSEGSTGYLFGETVFPPEEEDSLSSTQQVDLASQVREIISNTDLHRKVLLYEPIFVEDLHARLKANKIKCSFQALLDVLDDLCIIVRTQASQNRNKKKTLKKRREKLKEILDENLPTESTRESSHD